MPEKKSKLKNKLEKFKPSVFASKSKGALHSFSVNTHQGLVQDKNEDRVTIITNISKPKSKILPDKFWPTCSYFAIYDGEKGTFCADFLKDKLHEVIINQISFPANPGTALT